MSVLILVVDDEPDVASLFQQQFRRELRSGEQSGGRRRELVLPPPKPRARQNRVSWASVPGCAHDTHTLGSRSRREAKR